MFVRAVLEKKSSAELLRKFLTLWRLVGGHFNLQAVMAGLAD
jgi:hypothetical protein